ncbi:hypothetical protein QZH41_016536, partial [Actinostola sp. cb2023]
MAANFAFGRSLRSVVTSVTETVFPMSRSIRDYPRHHLINADFSSISSIFTGNELVSDLPLQMALYLNVHFSPFWFLTVFVMLAAKYQSLNFYYKFVLIAIYVVMAIVELTRLYLGYMGNLQEK